MAEPLWRTPKANESERIERKAKGIRRTLKLWFLKENRAEPFLGTPKAKRKKARVTCESK